MRPLRLRLEGFTAFRDPQEIDLSGTDLLAIAGPTGSGKSSLLDAIAFALYGAVPRLVASGERELISHGRDRLSVLLDFSAGARRFRVARTLHRGRAGTAQLEEATGDDFRSLASGDRKVTPEIERLLGLDRNAFFQSVILPQGRFAAFLQSAPRERRTVLRELLRLEVYEEMRRRAGQKEREAEVRLEERRRDLLDLADATPAAVEDAAARLEELSAANATRQGEVVRAETAAGEARRLAGLTAELLEAEARRDRLADAEAAVQEAERRLSASRRAARALPALEREERATLAATRAGDRRAEAARLLAEATRGQREAAAALAAALEEAAALPGLEERLRKLDEVRALLAPRDDARREAEAARLEAETTRDELAVEDAASSRGAARLAEARRRLTSAEEAVGATGWNAERERRLEELRELATSLAGLRAGLPDLDATAARSRDASEQAGRLAAEAESARAPASARLSAARASREEAESEVARETRHDLASHLRRGLKKGEPCPVCTQAVKKLPPGEAAAEALERARARLELARLDEEKSALASRAADEAAAAARARHEAAREKASADEGSVERARDLVKAAEARLAAPLAELIPPAEQSGAIEATILRALRAEAERRQRHQERASERDLAREALGKLEREEEDRGRRVAVLTGKAASLTERSTRAAARARELDARIAAVTADPDPAAERERIASRRAALERAAAGAREKDAAARKGREAAETRTRDDDSALAEAQAELESARAARAEALASAGFEQAGDVRAASLRAVEEERLAESTARHARERHAVAEALTSLAGKLAGRRVSSRDLEAAESTWRDLRRAHEAGLAEAASSGERLEALRGRARSAERLRSELDLLEGERSRCARLALDLQSDRFQSFLLRGVFRDLVRGASQRLLELSDGRYGLELDADDAFLVVDNDNAGEKRSAETLSGGETFLASLALALELSQQVQRAAGAVHLESLFIDEGFGSLDPETLETVTSAIERLADHSRMVGVISHLPELTQRLPVRVLIDKRSTGSTVSVTRG